MGFSLLKKIGSWQGKVCEEAKSAWSPGLPSFLMTPTARISAVAPAGPAVSPGVMTATRRPEMQQDSRNVLQSGNAGHFSPGTVNVAKNLVIHAAATNQEFLGCAGTSAQVGQQSLQYKAGPLSPLSCH